MVFSEIVSEINKKRKLNEINTNLHFNEKTIPIQFLLNETNVTDNELLNDENNIENFWFNFENPYIKPIHKSIDFKKEFQSSSFINPILNEIINSKFYDNNINNENKEKNQIIDKLTEENIKLTEENIKLKEQIIYLKSVINNIKNAFSITMSHVNVNIPN